MKKLALLLVALVALAGATASAKPKKPPKPKGKPPTVYAVEAAPIAWRQTPSPTSPPGIFVICWQQMPTCPLSHVTFKVKDQDSNKVELAHRVIDRQGKVWSQSNFNWVGDDPWLPTENRISVWWMAKWDTPTGFYRWQIRVRDPQKNLSPWVTSAEMLYV